MSPLRKQLEDDLATRGMSDRTREAYVGAVAALAKHYGRSRDRISEEDTDRYLLHLLTERKLASSSYNVAAGAFQFFYRITLKRSAAEFPLPRPKQPQKLPQILAREEIARLFAVSDNLKHRAMLIARTVPRCAARNCAISRSAHRPHPNHDPRRAGQGRQGPLHAALRAAARRALPLLARLLFADI